MSNEFESSIDSPMQAARNAAAVTPNDGTDLSDVSKALYIGVAGDVTVTLVDDSSSVTFKDHPVGYLIARVQRVHATGTAATNILNLY